MHHFLHARQKSMIAGKTVVAVNNTNSSVKNTKDSCPIKASKQRLENIRNTISQL